MKQSIQHFISPNFTHEKLETSRYEDFLDVFEDRMINWIIMPANHLLKLQHGEIAATAIATNYIEAIEIYISGKDSRNQSKKFFRNGFHKVFTPTSITDISMDIVADTMYNCVRCGFSHDAMFRDGIYFSKRFKGALTVTWPKANGEFDRNGKVESIFINPKRFIECIELHFEQYMKSLRTDSPGGTKERFLAAVKTKWNLEKPGHIIGMTEADFLKEDM